MVDSKENYKFGLGVKELTFLVLIGSFDYFDFSFSKLDWKLFFVKFRYFSE